MRLQDMHFQRAGKGLFLLLAAIMLLPACAPQRGLDIPEPLREPRAEFDEERIADDTEVDERQEERTEPRMERREDTRYWREVSRQALDEQVDLGDGEFDVNFESIPLPSFINEVFGNLLGQSYHMASEIRDAEDLVTLRLSEPRSARDLHRIALSVLEDYGVGVYEDEGVLRFVADADATRSEAPLLVSGRALPDVPATHRPVFHMVPLHVVRNTQVRNWLNQMYRDKDLTVNEDSDRNMVILKGPPRVVSQALDAIEVLDQPFMRGRHALRIDPAFRRAGELAEDLTGLLEAQGYSVASRPGSGGAVVMVPIEATNMLIVFTAARDTLDEISHWVRELDQLTQAPDETGIFRYMVRNTSAESIASVLQQVMDDRPDTDRDPEGERDQRNGRDSRDRRRGARLVVDEGRNTIMFQGTGEQWSQLRPLMQEMDVPARSVMVEVTIAEVTLTEEYSSGVEWAMNRASVRGTGGPLGTEDGLSMSGRGINWFPTNDSGNTRAIIQAFAGTDRVSILSTPRVLVRSGEEANITVGTDIPIITGEATRPDVQDEGTSGLFRQVQFRKTGVLLNVRPIIHAGNRVDLDITQEVSEAQQTDTSGIDSPTILERSVNTAISLRDGGSVMLGGLITSNEAEGDSRVPGLGRIPVLGRLFRTESRTADRTELIVLIVPYILDDHEDAEAITRAFRDRLQIERVHPSVDGPNGLEEED